MVTFKEENEMAEELSHKIKTGDSGHPLNLPDALALHRRNRTRKSAVVVRIGT